MRILRVRPSHDLLACLLVALLAVGLGCSDDDREPDELADEPGRALYVLPTYVFSDETATSYLTLLDEIDERDDIDLAAAAEFAGWSIPAGFEGRLFVSSGESPEVTRYSVSARNTLRDPRRLSFARFTSTTAPMYRNLFIDESTAVMNLDDATRVAWDPSTLEIRGQGDAPPVPIERDGMTVAVYAWSEAVQHDHVFQSYYWHDEDWYAFHPESKIVVHDSRDLSLETELDAACPALHRASADEDGDLYYSPLGDIIGYQLLDENAPRSCVVRIDAGRREIASGWPKDFAELTGGRRYGEFHYLKDQRGILTVYHDERATIGSDTAPNELIVAANWRLWLVDLEAWTAEPIEDIDWLAGGTDLSTLDGRAFLFTSDSEFATTTIYEITAEGRVHRLFATPGYAERFAKVR